MNLTDSTAAQVKAACAAAAAAAPAYAPRPTQQRAALLRDRALDAHGMALVAALAGSITRGCDQACSSPGGLIVRVDALDQALVHHLAERLAAAPASLVRSRGLA